VFAGGAVFIGVLFIRALFEREIRSGLFTYAAMCVATAIGLWRVRRWGRNLALIVTMGNLGLAVMTLLAVIMAREGPVVGPTILLAISLALSYWLSRPAFNLPYE
jgi:uncharacterized membrane protein (DUF2068 family)